jgi:flagellar hook-associated protein 1 FlgK
VPVSTFLGIQTTLRGILAQQRALDTTSHNIANANTVGYTRQEALFAASAPYTYPAVSRPPQAGQLGTGVDVVAYRRIRDGFIDVQLRAQTMRKGQSDALDQGLKQVELALAEPGDNGINALLGRYWSAWHDVANNPENLATRQALVQSASALAEGVRSVRSQLDTIVAQAGQNVTLTIADVNAIGVEIASLTDEIVRANVVGDQPNDLLDKRDALLDRLSSLGNVSVTSGADGSIDVTIGGAVLTTGNVASTVTEAAMTSLTSGKLAGLRQLRDTTVPGYVTQLDTVVAALIAQTNARHAAGFTLTGAGGGTFFTGTGSADVAVNAALAANPALVAASSNGQPGNNANALSIAALRTTAVIGSSTIDTAYAQFVTTIGSDALDARRDLDNASILVDSLEDRRQSVSGVSLDEEMVNLVRFQRAYQASSRAMSALDEMIELLVTRTGRVGL